ncbi:ABC transporter permease [Candidatus Saccharibacteria bacterium]|nr:ABC transporter permease [Candidatus Saccharibacteria bacterium]
MRSVTDTIYISPDGGKRGTGLRELWVYRELFFFFAWRDIKVRYKQSFLGIGWAVLQPAINAAIFTIFFNQVAKIDTGSLTVPYPVFAYLGLSYWGAFNSATTNVSNSILNNIGVINKIYFPRLIPPLSAVALAIVDFCFAMLVFVILILIFRVPINIVGLICVIPALLILVFAAFAIGLVFAALNIKYRDARSLLPFIIQATFFMTPVIYPVTMIPVKYRLLAYINPATGPIDSIKALLFSQPVNWLGLCISMASALAVFIIGMWAFRRTERHFVDYL